MSNFFHGKMFAKISELEESFGPYDSLNLTDEFVVVNDNITKKITGLNLTESIVSIGNLASKAYVDAVVDGAPELLNTLNEIAAALNDDSNFASNIISSINTKLPTANFGLEFWSALEGVNTFHIAEGSNLYYTQARFDTALAAKTTTALAEGDNLYYTEQRVLDVVIPLVPTSIFDLDVPEVSVNLPGYLHYNGTTLSWQLGGAISSDPVFDSVTTTQLNVKNIAFTGTGAVNIGSGNDLNLTASGDITFNGQTLSSVATSGSYNDLTDKPTTNSVFENVTITGNITSPTHAATKSYVDSQLNALPPPVWNSLSNVSNDQGPTRIALGRNAGGEGDSDGYGGYGGYGGTDSPFAIAIGSNAGKTNQGGGAIGIGVATGYTNQGAGAIAIGLTAGNISQGLSAIAIGESAGNTSQGNNSVAIGNTAGYTNQGINAVAIGADAGVNQQGVAATSVGWQAGQSNQGVNSVAIGARAGESSQGHHAIAIGASAGWINQPNYTIILNATGSAINGVGGQEASFYVAPIRDATPTAKGMFYNTTTKEVTTATLAAVATSGSYNDLTNKPNIVEKTTGSWTLAAGANTVSLTVPINGAYSIWVNGNIPNGIVTYTATVVVTNTNVPVVGSSYGWYYADGNALVLTAIPTQVVGTANNISTSTVATTTANVFTFGITNNSGSDQVVNWGYTKL